MFLLRHLLQQFFRTLLAVVFLTLCYTLSFYHARVFDAPYRYLQVHEGADRAGSGQGEPGSATGEHFTPTSLPTTTTTPAFPTGTPHVIGRIRSAGGRLGNEMFVYASLLGIASNNQVRFFTDIEFT